MPGAQGSYLRADFSSPDVSNADYPALALGLVMLDDLLLDGLRGSRPMAYAAYTKLSSAAAPSGTIAVTRASSAEGAKAAVEEAIGLIASGQCLSPSGSGHAAIIESLDAYKLRAITRVYSRGNSAASLADHIARDLAAGGDGSSWFRLADRIRAVKATDIPRIIRNRLVDSPLAWSVVAPPEAAPALEALGFKAK
jgi:predicted Zn-dependent peptidase